MKKGLILPGEESRGDESWSVDDVVRMNAHGQGSHVLVKD